MHEGINMTMQPAPHPSQEPEVEYVLVDEFDEMLEIEEVEPDDSLPAIDHDFARWNGPRVID